MAGTVLGPDPVRVELSPGTRVCLAWRSAGGDDLPAADARRRYEEAGVSAGVRVVAESAIGSGEWSGTDAPLRAPADRRASSKDVSFSLCLPTPFVKNISLGTRLNTAGMLSRLKRNQDCFKIVLT